MTISFIGSGNAATHLALLCYRAGHTIDFVYSRKIEHARKLARKVRAGVAKAPADLLRSDCILIAVNDDAIHALADRLPDTRKLVAHTSGSEALSVLRRFPNRGVLYPVQTLTAGAPTPSRIPFCIEASSPVARRCLRKLARSISSRIVETNSRDRRIVHAAAVFSNNFTNHLYAVAGKLVERAGIPFSILLPLIEETARKVEEASPGSVQTGPARRGDRTTMQAHLDLLGRNKKLKALYKILSDDIATAARRK